MSGAVKPGCRFEFGATTPPGQRCMPLPLPPGCTLLSPGCALALPVLLLILQVCGASLSLHSHALLLRSLLPPCI